MKNYKGYYIDKSTSNNEKEIDEFIKKQAIDSYKNSVKLFDKHPTLENSNYCGDKAERLVSQFGLTWEQVGQIENEVFKSL